MADNSVCSSLFPFENNLAIKKSSKSGSKISADKGNLDLILTSSVFSLPIKDHIRRCGNSSIENHARKIRI